MRILLTGASGFIGSTLAPALLAEGHDLRALARNPARARNALARTSEIAMSNGGVLACASQIDVTRGDMLACASQIDVTRGDMPACASQIDVTRGDMPACASQINVIRGDVLTGEGLAQALKGVEVAYYLIHSMESRSANPSHQSPFTERERQGAETFATHARRAGVGRIVYLGGPLPHSRRASRHLASRAEVEGILLEHVPDSVALRASIVIGARSRSFRLLVRLVERLPVLALPAWRGFRTQPIDVRDVIEMLTAAACLPDVGGRTLDIGGPRALTYEQMLQRIAELLLLPRPTLPLRVTMTQLTARLAAALAGEDPELILPLMESLEGDLLPADDHAAELLGVELHSFDSAVECALREWEMVEPLAAR